LQRLKRKDPRVREQPAGTQRELPAIRPDIDDGVHGQTTQHVIVFGRCRDARAQKSSAILGNPENAQQLDEDVHDRNGPSEQQADPRARHQPRRLVGF
jgi:hypothetical protein